MRHISSLNLRIAASKLKGKLPTAPLGKTGLTVTRLGLGGGCLVSFRQKRDEAIDAVRRAVDLGINYIDTAPEYGDGEKNLGIALEGLRDRVILATKSSDRTYDGCLKDLEGSLKDLKTGHIDLWQIHHVDHTDEVAQISKGAIKAFQKAREEGIVKHIGVTGHYDPKPVHELLKRFEELETVLMPVNAADVHHESFIKGVLPTALKRNLGVIAMKVTCYGRIFHPPALNSMRQALYYTLTQPVSTSIVGVDDVDQLIQNVDLVKDFEPLSAKEMSDLEAMTKHYAHLALFFRKGNEDYNPFWKSYPQKHGK